MFASHASRNMSVHNGCLYACGTFMVYMNVTCIYMMHEACADHISGDAKVDDFQRPKESYTVRRLREKFCALRQPRML